MSLCSIIASEDSEEKTVSRIEVTETVSIGRDELRETFVRSPGPGGQNVNKVATAVQLRFDVRRSPSLPQPVRERLIKLAGSRLTEEGELIIEAHRFRTRERNRRDALERLVALIRRATREPKPRKKTRPSRAAVEQRLREKQHRSDKKKQRRPVRKADD
jgi:ribosome-associated protein